MAGQEDLQSWADRERLPQEVITTLKDQGFSCVDQLKTLTPDDIKLYFQDSGMLNIAQCLTLKKAVIRLSQTSSSASGFTAQHQPYPSSYPSHPPPQVYPPSSHPSFSASMPSPPTLAPYPTSPQELQAHPQPYPGNQKGYPGSARECFRFLLLGKTGSGKSTTGNTIFGERLFDTAATFSSVTSNCERKSCQRGGRKIEIVDSPGLYDTHKTQEEICITIVQAVAGMHPGPHAVLYVVRLGRYTAEEFGAYQRLKALFDDHITRYLVVVFTHGDMLEREGTSIDDLIQKNTTKELQQVLRECSNRYIVFNNMASDPRPQVQQLLQKVRDMMAQNGGRPYSCPKYGEIGAGMEKEVARRLQEVEKRDLKRQKYVQQLEKQAKEAEDAVRKTKEQFEKSERERQRQVEEEQRKQQQTEEKLQKQMKQQAQNLEKHQQELQRLQSEREEQERRMKEKEQEMTENEKRRAQVEAERMRQREQEMQAMTKWMEEAAVKQREEYAVRCQQMKQERQQFLQQMEDQRRKDMQEMARREEEREQLREKQNEEMRAAAKRMEANYESEMEKLKQRIVDKQVDFTNKVVNVAVGVTQIAVALWLLI